MARFFDWLLGKHTCQCGAAYRMTLVRSPSPDTDDACCEVCGKVMDSWEHATHYWSYDLLNRTDKTIER
jgi:hypothetical protein